MFVKIAADSDDELPCIMFSRSSVPSEPEQKIEEVTASTSVTEVSSGICRESSDPAHTDSADVVVVDSDSSDRDCWEECVTKYSTNLRARCDASKVLSLAESASPCAESCDLQLAADSAKTSVTDSQSCCNSVTDDSPAAWKSCEDSEEFASEQLSQRTSSDMNSQCSSVQSDTSKRRKRQLKTDDPEAVVHIL